MLAKINWTFLIKPELYEETITKLIEAIKTEISYREQNSEDKDSELCEEDVYYALNNHAPKIEMQGKYADYYIRQSCNNN